MRPIGIASALLMVMTATAEAGPFGLFGRGAGNCPGGICPVPSAAAMPMAMPIMPAVATSIPVQAGGCYGGGCYGGGCYGSMPAAYAVPAPVSVSACPGGICPVPVTMSRPTIAGTPIVTARPGTPRATRRAAARLPREVREIPARPIAGIEMDTGPPAPPERMPTAEIGPPMPDDPVPEPEPPFAWAEPGGRSRIAGR